LPIWPQLGQLVPVTSKNVGKAATFKRDMPPWCCWVAECGLLAAACCPKSLRAVASRGTSPRARYPAGYVNELLKHYGVGSKPVTEQLRAGAGNKVTRSLRARSLDVLRMQSLL
jgi:hypothetical protein